MRSVADRGWQTAPDEQVDPVPPVRPEDPRQKPDARQEEGCEERCQRFGVYRLLVRRRGLFHRRGEVMTGDRHTLRTSRELVLKENRSEAQEKHYQRKRGEAERSYAAPKFHKGTLAPRGRDRGSENLPKPPTAPTRKFPRRS